MKRTLTVNLNSQVFNIDEDAYEVLKKYLSDVSVHFSSDDERDEIMADIEARIAELFSEKIQSNKNVITIEDVNEIIIIMGSPNQYSDSDDGDEQVPPELPKTEKKKRHRRFYRDPENAILGGIAAGLSAYIGMDVTLLRIILVLLIFVGVGFLIPIYLIVWIVAPEAVTPSQRLEMQGEDVTIENIKAEFNQAKNYVQSDDFKKSARTVGQKLGAIFTAFIKIIFGFVGVVLSFVGVIVLIVLFSLLIALIFTPMVLTDFIPDFLPGMAWVMPGNGILFILSLVLVVGCPIFLIIYWIVRLASGRKSQSHTTFWVTIVLWLTGIFMLVSTTAHTAIDIRRDSHSQSGVVINWNLDEHSFVYEDRSNEPFSHINLSGSFNTRITQGTNSTLTLGTESDFLSSIVTEVKNETLFVYSRNSNFDRSVRLDLTTNSLYSITAEGLNAIHSDGMIRSGQMDIRLEGANHIKLDLDVERDVKLAVEGTTNVNLQGTAENLQIKASGINNIKADALKARNVNIKFNDMGRADVYATDRLDATARGLGRIYCYGNPVTVNKSADDLARVKMR